MQTLAEQFASAVAPSKTKEFGHAEIIIEEKSVLIHRVMAF